MSTYTEGRRLHHSCTKRNLNPCDTCTKPRKSSTRHNDDNCSSATKKTGKSRKCSKEYLLWSCNAIKPLANFYDSIPDYCDIHDLPKNEFESTLCNLKATCQSLKNKALSPPLESIIPEDTSTSSFCSLKPKKVKKCKTSSKKRCRKTSNMKKYATDNFLFDDTFVEPCHNSDYDKNQFKSFRDDCEKEFEAFRQSLNKFEKEIKEPIDTTTTTTLHPIKVDECVQTCDDELLEKPTEKYLSIPQKYKFESCLNESLKKSLSLNDIQANPQEEFATHERKKLLDKLKCIDGNQEVSAAPQNTETELLTYQQEAEVEEEENKKKVEEINLVKKKRAKSEENYRLPYSIFEHYDSKVNHLFGSLKATPVHPVARPNLAATLREQVARQKLNKQRTSCTFSDGTKHFDWEVRKTPAWKSLSLQETHDQTLMLRLAARKAEQALQQRQYELNLALMRQRVKSAPLLLEGETHWGPSVGRLSHHCHEEGLRHICHSNLSVTNSRQHMRTKSKKSQTPFESFCEHHRNIANRDAESHLSHKLQTMCKIYDNSAKKSTTPLPKRIKPKSSRSKSRSRCTTVLGSGDELSSIDRAFL